MIPTNPSNQPIEPVAHALTIREAESATGINSRSIRRRLAAGVFPGAYKDTDCDRPNARVWRIPVGDLEAAGLGPLDLARPVERELVLPVITSSPLTAATLIGTDRFARLRTELAEAVAAAELTLLRAEVEKWRAIAEERGRALERADLALQTLVTTLGPAASPGEPPPRPATYERQTATTAVPPHVRSEAVLYAEKLSARRSAPEPWWRRRR
ncbi:MAG: hypothetical protein M3Q30_06670 [Actinomycetota bacterium]|nr:hypothetical protein [Actinomycetota bacterium]